MIDARAGVDDLHDEAFGARLVDELELAPLDDQELPWPCTLAKERLPAG